MKGEFKKSRLLLATSHFIALLRECREGTSFSCFVMTLYYPSPLLFVILDNVENVFKINKHYGM